MDNIHYDKHTRSSSLEPLYTSMVQSFDALNSVFKKIDVELEHYTDIQALDDETYWQMVPPKLPNCK